MSRKLAAAALAAAALALTVVTASEAPASTPSQTVAGPLYCCRG